MIPESSRLSRLKTNGPLWLAVSALMFAFMAVMVRVAGQQSIPGSETTLVRFLFGMVTIAILHATGAVRVRIGRMPLLAARGIAGGIAIVLYFLSLAAAKGYGSTSLTNSVFLGNSYFIYIPIFSAVLIRERPRVSTLLAVVLALMGLYFIVQPDFSHIRLGDIYGFGAGIVSAVAIVIIRELRKTESAVAVFLALCVFGSVVALGTMAFQKPVWPTAFGWLALLVMGITGTLGQLLMTHALRYSRAGEAGIIQMTTVVYSSLAGILWFGDLLSWKVLLGAALVLGAGAYVSISESIRPSSPCPIEPCP